MSQIFDTPAIKRAFLWAPLASSLVMTVGAILPRSTITESTTVEDLFSVALIFTFMSYLGAFTVGLPVLALLRRFEMNSLASCIAGGGLSGFLFLFLPYALWYGFTTTLHDRHPEMIACTVAGMAAGLVFDLLCEL